MMKDKVVRLTIGMPVYNGDDYLAQAIESILGQTLGDFELIISDNASTDGTEEICRGYAQKDERVRYHRNQKNLGAARNYNYVVETARGPLFKWAAHDDLCRPRYLEHCVVPLEQDADVVVCYPKTRIIDENGEDKGEYRDDLHLDSPSSHERFRTVLFREAGECNAVFGLIRTETLRTTGVIGNYPASDMILLGELALHGKFYEVPEPLFLRRDHPETSVRANISDTDRAAWFDPNEKKKKQRNHWRWTREYARAIGRSGVGWNDKSRCYAHLGRWVAVHRRRMMRELGASVN
jgi:glycosyltransferase involved in cell wall biosynthesis